MACELKMLEYGRAHFELQPNTGQLIEKVDADDEEISFEELLAQEKKDSFWYGSLIGHWEFVDWTSVKCQDSSCHILILCTLWFAGKSMVLRDHLSRWAELFTHAAAVALSLPQSFGQIIIELHCGSHYQHMTPGRESGNLGSLKGWWDI